MPTIRVHRLPAPVVPQHRSSATVKLRARFDVLGEVEAGDLGGWEARDGVEGVNGPVLELKPTDDAEVGRGNEGGRGGTGGGGDDVDAEKLVVGSEGRGGGSQRGTLDETGNDPAPFNLW